MLTETQWDQLDAIFRDDGRHIRMLAAAAYIIVDASHQRIGRDEYATHERQRWRSSMAPTRRRRNALRRASNMARRTSRSGQKPSRSRWCNYEHAKLCHDHQT